jgi:hypothetical protein
MPKGFLVATFSDPATLLNAVETVRSEDLRVYDVFAPYPVHGLDEVMGLRRTRLPWVTVLVGLCGLTFALCFQYFAAVFDWPINVGGKPDNSTLAFIPICFELTVLSSGLATVFALFVRSRLYPGKLAPAVAAGVTDDIFALVVRRPDSDDEARRATAVLEKCGARDIEEKATKL